MGIPVLVAFLGFIFSEVSFYQILLRGEVLSESPIYSNLSLKIAIGYYPGTAALCILKSKKISDSLCAMLGLLASFLSIAALAMLNYIQGDNQLNFTGLIIFFSFGFGLFTPCLFAILSKYKKLNEQGKIYGLLDSTDTLSGIVAIKLIKSNPSVGYNSILLISWITFFISCILIMIFIKIVKSNKESQNGAEGVKF